jgi:CxxC motif-containing protein
MVSVKTAEPIPREHIFDVMDRIRAVSVDAPVTAGTVILDDVFGTQIVATKTIR